MTRIQLDISFVSNWMLKSKQWHRYHLWSVTGDCDLIGWLSHVQLDLEIQNLKITTLCDLWLVTRILLDNCHMSNWTLKFKIENSQPSVMTYYLWLGFNWMLVSCPSGCWNQNSKFSIIYNLWPVTGIQLDNFHMSNLTLKFKIENSLPSVTCDLWLGSN